MERFKVMKASGSKHSLNKYYGATAEDVENTAGLLQEMTSVLGNSQADENASGTCRGGGGGVFPKTRPAAGFFPKTRLAVGFFRRRVRRRVFSEDASGGV